MQTTKGA